MDEPRMSPELQAAGRRRYVALTTFRRTGTPVSTAVWIAPVGAALVVVTGAATGKAKRLRNDPRVELRECSARGRVREGALVVLARAEIVTDPEAREVLLVGHHRKYGWQYRGYELVERLLTRGAPQENVVLRITDR
jgi:PPOX class probable F420-dependent enzyme